MELIHLGPLGHTGHSKNGSDEADVKRLLIESNGCLKQSTELLTFVK